jgi:hypothetical protein
MTIVTVPNHRTMLTVAVNIQLFTSLSTPRLRKPGPIRAFLWSDPESLFGNLPFRQSELTSHGGL